MIGITNTGKATEQRVIDNCSSIRENKDKSPKGKKKGDLVYKLPSGEEIYIEVKKTTWNQTRPAKYIVCVGYHEKTKTWYIAPPDRLMYYASQRTGQHTSDPFRCVGFGAPNSSHPMWKEFKLGATENLQEKIMEAYQQGENHPAVKKFAEKAWDLHNQFAAQMKQEYELLNG